LRVGIELTRRIADTPRYFFGAELPYHFEALRCAIALPRLDSYVSRASHPIAWPLACTIADVGSHAYPQVAERLLDEAVGSVDAP
jgi:hypothetical protein